MFPIAANRSDEENTTPYVDDVFSTYLYTGNDATQTITNGIDLAGKGGMVWLKDRTQANPNGLFDTNRGVYKLLISNTTDAQQTVVSDLTAFNSNGFSIGSDSWFNDNISNYASWTFRKAAKFFDVVTYTGTGSARTIAHSLGVAPGMIIVKKTNSTGQWCVYHRGLTSAAYTIFLNLTDSQTSDNAVWNSTAPTSSVFTVGDSTGVNNSGDTYVAYLYAHDTSSTGIIQCGSFSYNNSIGNDVNLGWEPQYVMIKDTTTAGAWWILDTMRGFSYSQGNGIRANTSQAEQNAFSGDFRPTATGFRINAGYYTNADDLIYMAIRMPNKPPTLGTQVYMPIAYNGDGTSNRLISTYGFAPDLIIGMARNQTQRKFFWDRLRGASVAVDSTTTDAEYSTGTAISLSTNMLGVSVTDNGASYTNTTGYNYDDIGFKRAPGFFDEVCYTVGTNNNWVYYPNFGVKPELIISKARDSVQDWVVNYDRDPTYAHMSKSLRLNSAAAAINESTITTHVSSVFDTGYFNTGGYSGRNPIFTGNIVAYLFATLAGISKVGSYTGNGSSQNIECGFAAGARFVLIKRTDSTGDWYTWDTARGIVTGNDPHLSLNSTAAEVTTDDSIDPYSPGFTVNQVAATNINVTSATYIFLAIA